MKAKEIFAVGEHNIGWVSEFFQEQFADTLVESGVVLQSKTLLRNMTDDEIIKKFDVKECSLGDVLATLDAGTEEMKDGNYSFFYVGSCVVFVCWDVDGRGWFVFAWERGVSRWGAGRRVFSPATDTDIFARDSMTLGNFDTLPDLLTINEIKYRKI